MTNKRNLEQIRRWYSFWSATPQIAKQAASQLFAIPWWHNVVILSKCQTHAEALYYVQQTQIHGWSRVVLTHQIESGLWQRAGQALSNFIQTLFVGMQGQLPSIGALEKELGYGE
jgi:predicted nuclease of restriction endonuclease-like (RecB) superfamily